MLENFYIGEKKLGKIVLRILSLTLPLIMTAI